MTESLIKQTSLKQKLLSGGIWAFVGKFGTVLATLTVNALLTRLLAPEEIGAYFLTYSMITIGAVIAQLGLNHTIVRFIAESVGQGQDGRASASVKGVFSLATLGVALVATVVACGGSYVASHIFHSPHIEAIIPLVTVWIVVFSYQGLIAESFRGYYDIRLATIFGGLVTSIVFATFLAWRWASQGHSQLSLTIIFAIVAVFVNNAIGGYLLKRRVFSLGKKYSPEWKNIFSIAMPLLATNVTLFMVNYADLWVLGALSSQDEVAIYGTAARLVATIAIPLMIVNSVVSPMIAEMYAQNKIRRLENLLRSCATFATIPAFLLVTCFMLFGEDILGFLFGDYYRQGITVLVFLSIGRLANVWAGSCGLSLMLTGHQKSMMIITIFSATVLVTSALLVADTYGAKGVAAVSCLSMILQNLLMLAFSRIHTGIWTHASFNIPLMKKMIHEAFSTSKT